MKIKLFFYCLLFFNINLLRSSELFTLVDEESLLRNQLRKETDPNKQASLEKQIKDIESLIINESKKKKAAGSSKPNFIQEEELDDFRKTLKAKQLEAKAATAAKAAKAATAQRTIASENLKTTRLFDDPRPGSFDQKLQQARDTKVELQQKSLKSNMQKELLARHEAFGGVMQKKRLPIGKPLDTTVEIKQFFLKEDMQKELLAKSMQKDLKRDMQKELLAKSMQKDLKRNMQQELLTKSAANSGTMQKRLTQRVQSFKPIKPIK